MASLLSWAMGMGKLQVWKVGARLRMDGSFMGLDDKSRSLIPQVSCALRCLECRVLCQPLVFMWA